MAHVPADPQVGKRSRVHLANGATTTMTCSRGGTVVGRIFKVPAAPEGRPWMWTLSYGYHEEPHSDA